MFFSLIFKNACNKDRKGHDQDVTIDGDVHDAEKFCDRDSIMDQGHCA